MTHNQSLSLSFYSGGLTHSAFLHAAKALILIFVVSFSICFRNLANPVLSTNLTEHGDEVKVALDQFVIGPGDGNHPVLSSCRNDAHQQDSSSQTQRTSLHWGFAECEQNQKHSRTLETTIEHGIVSDLFIPEFIARTT